MSDENGLPRGWVRASLDAVGALHCGQSPSVSEVNHDGDGTPYVTGPDQWDGNALTVDKWTTKPKRVVPNGCIFVTVKGAGVGTLFPGVACAIGRDVYAYEPSPELSTRFVEHSLRYNISEILRHAKGDIPGLSKGHILGHVTAFPPRNEQERIVAKIDELLSDLDAGVAALERARANLKRYRAAVLRAAVEGKLTEQWRGEHPATEPASKLLERILAERRKKWEEDQLAKSAVADKTPPNGWREKYVEPAGPETSGLPELPKGWCWARVEQVGHVQLGRQRSPKHHNGPYMRPYLRVANVFEDRIDISDVMEMNFSPGEYETYRLGFSDILLNEGQSMELIGRSAMYRKEVPGACFTNTLVRFRAKEGVDPHYALKVFLAYLKNGRFQKVTTITVNIAHLGAGRFAEIEFPLPPIEEQAAIIEEVDRHFSMIEAAERAISTSLVRGARLRQSILKQAFEGRLVPQDPHDEPASALLARIRESREAEARILPVAKAGRERPAASAGRRRQPAGNIFRRGAVACYIIRALTDKPSFGRTQLEKVLHLTQAHLGVDLALEFERYPAGPFDKTIYKLEGFARKRGWFGTEDRPSVGVRYRPGPNIDERCEAAVAILGEKRAGLDELLAHVAGMDTDAAELFATVYAAWNDLLIDGRAATPEAIIAEVYGWDESKKRFPESRITRRIDWMKEHGYIPTGTGQRTSARPPDAKKSPRGRKGP